VSSFLENLVFCDKENGNIAAAGAGRISALVYYKPEPCDYI
jgi:hypothetical protein